MIAMMVSNLGCSAESVLARLGLMGNENPVLSAALRRRRSFEHQTNNDSNDDDHDTMNTTVTERMQKTSILTKIPIRERSPAKARSRKRALIKKHSTMVKVIM